MFEQLIGSMFKKTERAHADEFHKSGKAINSSKAPMARMNPPLISRSWRLPARRWRIGCAGAPR
jgi:hypothetical protein